MPDPGKKPEPQPKPKPKPGEEPKPSGAAPAEQEPRPSNEALGLDAAGIRNLLQGAELDYAAQQMTTDQNRNAVAVDFALDALGIRQKVADDQAVAAAMPTLIGKPAPGSQGGPLKAGALAIPAPPVPVHALPPSKAYLWSRQPGNEVQYINRLGELGYLETEAQRLEAGDPNSLSPELPESTQQQLIEVEKGLRTAIAFGDEDRVVAMLKRMPVPLAPGAKTLLDYFEDLISDPQGYGAQVNLTPAQVRRILAAGREHQRLLHAMHAAGRPAGQPGEGVVASPSVARKANEARKKLEEWAFEEGRRMAAEVRAATGTKESLQTINVLRESLRRQMGLPPSSIDDVSAYKLNEVYRNNPAMWIPGWLNQSINAVPIGETIRDSLKSAFGTGADVSLGAFESVYGIGGKLGHTMVEAATLGFAPGKLWDKMEETSRDVRFLQQELPETGTVSHYARAIGRELPFLAASMGAGSILRASTGWKAFAKANPLASKVLGPMVMNAFSSLPRFPAQVVGRIEQGWALDEAIYGTLLEQALELGISGIFQQSGIEGILRNKAAKEVFRQGIVRNLMRRVPEATFDAVFEGVEEGTTGFFQSIADKMIENGGDIAATMDWIASADAVKQWSEEGLIGFMLGGGAVSVAAVAESIGENRVAGDQTRALRESALAREVQKLKAQVNRAAEWTGVMGPELERERAYSDSVLQQLDTKNEAARAGIDVALANIDRDAQGLTDEELEAMPEDERYAKLRELGWTDRQIDLLNQEEAEQLLRHNATAPTEEEVQRAKDEEPEAGEVSVQQGEPAVQTAEGETGVGDQVGRGADQGRQVETGPQAPTADTVTKAGKPRVMTKSAEMKARLKEMGYSRSAIDKLTQNEARQILELAITPDELADARKTGRILPEEMVTKQVEELKAREAEAGAITTGAQAQAAATQAATMTDEQVEQDRQKLTSAISQALGLGKPGAQKRGAIRQHPTIPGALVIQGAGGAEVTVRFGNQEDVAKAKAAMRGRYAKQQAPNGYFDEAANEIVLFKESDSDFTLNHELIHWFDRTGLLTGEDIAALTDAAEAATLEDGTSLADMVRQKHPKNRYGTELIAEYVEAVKRGQIKPEQRTIVDKILDFLRDVARLLGFGASPAARVRAVMEGAPIARKPSTRWKDARQKAMSQPDMSVEATERVTDWLGDTDLEPAVEVAEQNQIEDGMVDLYEAGDVVRPPIHFSVHNQDAALEAAIDHLRSKGATEQFIEDYRHEMQELSDLVRSVVGRDADLFPRSMGEPYKGSAPGAVGPLRDNSDPLYVYSFDLVSTCIRRIHQAATAVELSRRLGKPLTSDQNFAVALVMRKMGRIAQCIECYVYSARRTMQDGLNKWQKLLNGDMQISRSKSQKEQAFKEQQEFIKVANAAGLTGNHIDFDRLLDPANGGKMPNPTLELPESGITVKFQDFIIALASAKVNKLKLYQEYESQILAIPDYQVEYLNLRAGLRFFSSSDFQAEHAIDIAQAIYHMKLRDIRGHMYTKIDDVIRMIGGTGMKIQTSMFGVTARKGKFKRTKLADGTIRIEVVDPGEVRPDPRAGFDWDLARQRREQFPDVGPVFVAKDDTQLAWALNQDWIDYVIPFHHSGMAKAHQVAAQIVDYTSKQNLKWVQWRDRSQIPKHLRRRVKTLPNGRFVVDPAKILKRHERYVEKTITLKPGVKIVKGQGFGIAAGRNTVPGHIFKTKEEAQAWLAGSDYADATVGRGPRARRYEVVEAPVYTVERDGKQVTDTLFTSKTQADKWAKRKQKNDDDALYVVNGKPVIPAAFIFGQDGIDNASARQKYLDICDDMGVVPVFREWRDHPEYIKLRKDYARTDTPFNPVDPKGIDLGVMSDVLGRYIGDFRDQGGRVGKVQEDVIEEVQRLMGEVPEGQLAVHLLQQEVEENKRITTNNRADSLEGTETGTTLFAEKWRKIAWMPRTKATGRTIFNSPIFKELAGRRNLDIGGEDATMPEGTVNLVYGPGQPDSRNVSLSESIQRDPVQTVTIRGHLDSVGDDLAIQMIKQGAAALDETGALLVYTNDPGRIAPMVKKYFGKVQRKGNIIAGTGRQADTSHLYFSLPNGRPNYANPSMSDDPQKRTSHDTLLDVIHETRPVDAQTVTAWEKEARERILTPELMDREFQRIERLVAGYFDPATKSIKTQGLNPVDMTIGRLLIDRFYNLSHFGPEAGREAAYRKYVRIANYYRDAGSDAGRAMRARHDRVNGPAARLNLFRSLVAEMPSNLAARRRRALARGDMAKVQRIDRQWERRVSQILFSLQQEGVDLSDLAEGERLMNNDYALGKMRKVLAKKRGRLQRLGDSVMEAYYVGMLSGTLTHVHNLLGNSVIGAYETTVQKWSEAAVGTVAQMFGAEAATTFAELPSFYRGLLTSLPRALQNSLRSLMAEEDVLETDILGLEESDALQGKLERARRGSIPGPVGKVYRLPLSALNAEDSFFKTIFARGAVGAIAFRNGKARGLTGDALTDYVKGALGDYSNDAWQEALLWAKELAFQTPLPKKLDRIISTLRNMEIPGTGITPLAIFIPFVRVPFNIYRVAMKMTPLGTLGTIVKVLFRNHLGYTGVDFQRDVARQIVAWPLFLLIRGLMGGDDDDDTRPALTGALQDPTRRGFREWQYTNTPPMSRRRPDGSWQTYSNLDPLSTTVSTAVDLWNAWDMQGTLPEKAGRFFGQLINSAEDRTFLRGVADLVNAFRQPARTFERLAVRVPATFIPNLYRQPARGMDVYLRDSKMLEQFQGEGWWSMYWRAVKAEAQIGEQTRFPIVDYFGRDVQKYLDLNSSTGLKIYESMLNPRTVQPDRANEFSLMLYRWNEQHPDKPFYPATPSPFVTIDGESRPMTAREKYLYFKLAGEKTLDFLKQMEPNTAQPTDYDIYLWEKAQEWGRMVARDAVFFDREYPREKLDAMVQRVMGRKP